MFTYMIEYIRQLFGYKNTASEREAGDEEFLAEELLNLEFENAIYDQDNVDQGHEDEKDDCFQRNGIVTYIEGKNILIDGMIYYENNNQSFSNLSLNDQVTYLGYKTNEDSVKVVRLLQCHGPAWGDEDVNVKHFKVIEHVIVGEVGSREDRYVNIKNSDLKFTLDEIESSFVPIVGDWLELSCRVQWDEEKPSQITADQVIKVIAIRPLRTVLKQVKVTHCTPNDGICDGQIYVDLQLLNYGFLLQVGSKVFVQAIESNQGNCTWRALSIEVVGDLQVKKNINNINEDSSLKIEKVKNVCVTQDIVFDKISYNTSVSTTINVCNNSSTTYKIIKCKVLNRKSDSQINIKPFLTYPVILQPNQDFNFHITCTPKFVGYSKEQLVLIFNDFEIKRWIEINVISQIINTTNQPTREVQNYKSKRQLAEAMKTIVDSKHKRVIPGVRQQRSNNFVSVKLGIFNIPNKIWSAILDTLQEVNYDNNLIKLEAQFPYLSSELNIANYIDKWHTLMYMEEVEESIAMRAYDKPKVFLTRYQEFLGLEIVGLSEKRPSLITGDRVIVKDIWDSSKPEYEGIIHDIKGNTVLLKFSPQFHNIYTGYDVSIQYFCSRTVYRKCHQAINLAISILGQDLLIPRRILCQDPQISQDKLPIHWFNELLNDKQKDAVHNILLGVCRPLPYCIYGPPGTGKTIAIVETILQILNILPDSRILVATPSNSAANLLTERLIKFKDCFSSSMIRLVAHHVWLSDTIPECIKPFCATMDVGKDNTAPCKQVIENGFNLHCRSSFIGKHRVTISTCVSLGSLAQMELPKGHFTHIIVDEAGQATEPEILIPLTFLNKDKGQIILAGDPMQLGPVVLSKYCKEFGLGESYLSRILTMFPYQKDCSAFKDDKYDKRLVTKLVDNYRSIENILVLPSRMFYDGTLVSRLNLNEPWITKLQDDLLHLFPNSNKNGGMYVYGIRGSNNRAKDNPSWYNPQEALMVLMSTCKLYKRNISPDQIGIISPYTAQIKYLRRLFDSIGAEYPKIGTVEEFQGQEREIILITTVRSSQCELNTDIQHSLGFVKHPKRLNVAITRGQVAVIIFCDPHLLSLDTLWCNVLEHVVKNNCYTGCDLPQKLIS